MTEYAIKFEGKTFTPNGLADIGSVNDHNKEIEARELVQWATKPDHACFYIVNDTVQTWLGTIVGTITRKNTYRNNFGSNITSLSVRGTNGARYYGRYGSDWSQFCRLTKSGFPDE